MPYLTNEPQQSGMIQDENGNALAVSRAFADPASSGDNAVVAAVAGKIIRVLGFVLMNNVATANNVRFRSATNSISCLFGFGAIADGIVYGPYNLHGWFQTNAGEALNINLSAATAVGVQVVYVLV